MVGKWVLSTSGTLAQKCKEYNVETIECDIEKQIIPIDVGTVDSIIFYRSDRAAMVERRDVH
jgi:hypothetical protein